MPMTPDEVAMVFATRTVDVSKLEYKTMLFHQPCGESSFGLANHAGCGQSTYMALVLPTYAERSPYWNSGVIAYNTDVYIFCCEDCLKQYK